VSFSASGAPPERRNPEGVGAEPPVDPVETPTHSDLPKQPDAAGTPPGEVPSTRTGTAFKSLIAGAIVLILLLVFILENTKSVKIVYFGVAFHLPLGVALLLAAIGGALLVGIIGSARILQLRRHVRRHRL
jgi:lipopolysaccharide assembly protein A